MPALLLPCGCTTTFIPDSKVPDLSEISRVTGPGAIGIVNAQPDTTKIEISQPGTGYTVYGNLHDWTDKAVESLARTLKKKNVTVSPSAPNTIKIAVTEAVLCSAGSGWSFRCNIVFTVDTGECKPFTLRAEDKSWKWYNACNGAMEKLVTVVRRGAFSSVSDLEQAIQEFM